MLGIGKRAVEGLDEAMCHLFLDKAFHAVWVLFGCCPVLLAV